MYYIYILKSESSDNFYIGYSDNPSRRLIEHNSSPHNTYTSKHRPWKIAAVFQCSIIEGEAMKIEKYIKRQKSRNLIEKLVDADFVPTRALAQLVRVPHVRD
ncbi:MAG: GIY-YIG nuclease family protein [Candidatus Dadabacteria bacterium]